MKRRKTIHFRKVSFGITTNYLVHWNTVKAMEKAWLVIENYYSTNPSRYLTINMWKKLYFKKSKRKSNMYSSAVLHKLATMIPEGKETPLIGFRSRRTRFSPLKVQQIIIPFNKVVK